MKKLLAILLSVLLVLGLFAGCGDDAAADATNAANGGSANGGSNGGSTNTTSNPYGALMLNANAAVEITFDKDGMVLDVLPSNEQGNILLGEYEGFLGSTCSEVVCELIGNSALAGFLAPEVNYIMIRQIKDAQLPNENFLEDIAKDAQAELDRIESTAVLVVLSAEDLDGDGYINLESAKELMLAAMALKEFDVLIGTDAPIDGKYSFHMTADTTEEYLIIDAVTGDVYPGTMDEVDYEQDNIDEEEFIDVTEPVEDNTDPTIATDPDSTEATEAAGA